MFGPQSTSGLTQVVTLWHTV